MKVLSIENLTYSYPCADFAAIQDVSLSFESGSYTALVGKNGSGKSTLARIAAGLLEPDEGAVLLAENTRIGIVFQSPKDQIICGTLKRDTAFGPENLGLSPSETELRTIESLNSTGMLSFAQKNCFSLSLGQIQKAALSGMLALDCEILILDEALSMIDAPSRENFFELLDILHKKGMTVIHITHDIEAAAHAQNIIIMDAGKIVWSGKVRDFFLNPEAVKTVAGEPLKTHPVITELPPSTQKTFSAQDISFSYSRDNILSDVTFNLYSGTLTAFTGESGSGKTTLFEIMAGLLIPEEGTLRSCTRPSFVQQNPDAALFETFAADDVAFGAENAGLKGKKLFERVKESMNSCGLPFEDFADRRTFYLSGGQKRRLAIAGIISLDSDIILFDEPTAGLDGCAKSEIMNMMHSLAKSGKTVVYSTHYTDEAAFADRVIHIEKGKIVSDSLFPAAGTQNASKGDSTENLTLQKPLDGAVILQSIRKYSSEFSGESGRKRSLLAKLPAAVKYLLFLLLFITSLSVHSVVLNVIMFAAGILYAVLSGCGKRLFAVMIKIIPYLLLFCIFRILFITPVSGEKILLSWKYFTLSPSKLFACLSILLHTESALCIIRGFASAMTEQEIITGFEDLLLPFKKIGLPVRYASVTVEIIFRFIPLLTDEAVCIIKTQLVRGGLRKSKGAVSRIRAILPLTVPLIIRTIRRAEALADALTVRGFK